MNRPAALQLQKPPPTGELTPSQVRRSFRCMIVASMLAVTGGQIFAGHIMTLICWSLGGKEGFIGLLKMLVFCASIVQLAIVPLAQRSRKRNLLIVMLLLALLFSMPTLAVKLVRDHFGPTIALGVLALCVTGRAISLNLSVPSWMGLLREMTPEEKRGRLLGRMRSSWQSTAMAVLILTGLYLGKAPPWSKLQLVLCLGVLAQLCRALVLLAVNNPPIRLHRSGPSYVTMLLAPLRNTRYLPYLLYCGSYGLALGMAESFKVVYMLRLGFGERFALVGASLVSFGAMSMLMFWGRLADKYGNRSVFGLNLAAMIVSTMLWVLVGPSTLGLVMAMVLFWAGGAFNSGNGIAQTRYMFSELKPELEAGYIAVTSAMVSLGVGLGAVLGGQFLRVSEGWHLLANPTDNYKLLFACTAALFFIPLHFHGRFKEPAETSSRHVFTTITAPIRVVAGAMLSWRMFDNNNGSDDDAGQDR